MKITLLCVGRLGRGPEAMLAADYVARATATGRALGLGPVEIVEVEARKSGKPAEGDVLLARIENAHLIACDERGVARTSRDFALHLVKLRDEGVRHVVLVIGGADGLDQAVLAAARERPGPRDAGRTGLSRRHHTGRLALSSRLSGLGGSV